MAELLTVEEALAAVLERARALPSERVPLQAAAGRVLADDARARVDLPPFQGGVAAMLGYELGRTLEAIPSAQYDDLQTPALAAGLYDVVVAFDHEAARAWIVSQGFPETVPAARRARAEARLA